MSGAKLGADSHLGNISTNYWNKHILLAYLEGVLDKWEKDMSVSPLLQTLRFSQRVY
jgi:hypothetical protein